MLQKLQNLAARIVTNSSYDSSASALTKILNWPTVADMIKVKTTSMVYKSINYLAPDYLSEIFTKNSSSSRKNLRNTKTDLKFFLYQFIKNYKTTRIQLLQLQTGTTYTRKLQDLHETKLHGV